MIQKLLDSCLGPVVAAEQQLRQRRLAMALFGMGAGGTGLLGLLALLTGWWSWPALLGWFGFLVVSGLTGRWIIHRRRPDLREIARRIEEGHPDLRAALLTAMDQKAGPGGELGFLQRRLLGEISEHGLKNRWVRQVAERRLRLAAWGQCLALLLFGASLWFLLGQRPLTRDQGDPGHLAGEAEAENPPGEFQLNIIPGHVSLEKGSKLIVEANFQGRAPASVTLLHRHAGGESRLPMQLGLEDHQFSTLIPKVDSDGSYQVLYEEVSSEPYSITIFEYPELLQADVSVTPPAYLGEEKKTLLDIRKLTVMEGSSVEWRLRVNKPVAAAELFTENGDILPLSPDPADSTLLVASHVPEQSQRYRVHLIDEADRSNQRPPWLTLNVHENTPPKLKLLFPGRDFEVSALQELPLEAEVWDDIEILRAGLSYTFRGEEKETVLAPDALPGGTKHLLSTLIDIESLGAREREFLTYHFWAEDRDKDGQIRRSSSDQFFAEVRLFEDVLREGASGGGMPGSQPSGEVGELIRVQKDILNAAWNLMRALRGGKAFEALVADVGVLRESQQYLVSKVEEALGNVEDAEIRTALEQAREHMLRAADTFGEAAAQREEERLRTGSESAKEAYAELLKARARETEITRSREPSSSGQQSEERQRNLNLELEQKELKYEEQSAASNPAQAAEKQENLAVLNRLKDLARRQEAIAEKIKELENQLRQADDSERAEIERQLKRLQEEQRELLRDMDELAERMDSDSNRADMAEEREQLAETRESVRDTAEQLASGQLADAANSATRASEQLEEMKEEFRQKTSRQFAREMSDLRQTARELSDRQETIGKQLKALAETPTEDSPSPESQRQRNELLRQVSEQSRQLSELLETMRHLSEQAEPSEPLLSNALYEAVRQAATGQVEESLQETGELAYYQRPGQAIAAEAAAARGIEELKRRVEKAAESILGNESDALRLARSELDQLIEEARREAERLAAAEKAEGGQQPGAPSETTGQEAALAQNDKAGNPAGPSPPEGETNPDGQSPTSDSQAKGAGPNPDAKDPADAGAPGQTPGEKALAQEGGTTPGDGAKPSGEGQNPGQGMAPLDSLAQEENRPGTPGEGRAGAQGPSPSEEGRGTGEAGRDPQASPGSGQRGSVSLGGEERKGGPVGPGGIGGPLFFEDPTEQRRPGPITGEDYEQWADRLGNVEEMLPQESLRSDLARIRDDARAMRIDFRRNDLPPGAATIQQRITHPLVELRQRVAEELAKQNRENPVAPIDRDPVPSEFRDLVRRYYEELGTGN